MFFYIVRSKGELKKDPGNNDVITAAFISLTSFLPELPLKFAMLFFMIPSMDISFQVIQFIYH